MKEFTNNPSEFCYAKPTSLCTREPIEGCDISRGTLAKIEIGIRKLKASEVSAFVKVLNLEYKDFLE